MTVTVAAAVVLAGGSGSRVGAGRNKVYLPLAGRPVLAWSLLTFARMPEIGPIVLVVRPEDRADARALLAAEPELADRADLRLVEGGPTRQESELEGLRALADRITAGEVDAVLVHDGARPLAGEALARAILAAARAHGGAVPGIPCPDLAVAGTAEPVTLGDVRAGPLGELLTAPAGADLVAVQTPQGFRAAPLLAACEAAVREGFVGTDTASCAERFGGPPARWVPGDAANIKITYPEDLRAAESRLASG